MSHFKRITIKCTISTSIMFRTFQMIDNKDMFHLSLKGHKQVASLLLIYFSIEHRIHEYFMNKMLNLQPALSDKYLIKNTNS